MKFKNTKYFLGMAYGYVAGVCLLLLKQKLWLILVGPLIWITTGLIEDFIEYKHRKEY